MKKNFLLILFFILGTILHIWFFSINEILRVADSFAYFQMSHYLWEFSQKWFGTGWFGFLYSLPIAMFQTIFSDDFLSARLVNLLLFNLWGFFLYRIAKKYLKYKYLLLLIALYFLSPVLLHFNIHILSENIYIPLFLGLIWFLQNFTQTPTYQKTVFLWLFIALLYLTRWEAFIYLGSLLLLFIWLFYKSSYKKIILHSFILVFSFFIFVFPYLFHLSTITWEWGLTNKWASNLRQAELRGTEKMDDNWFEQAVAELTDDKHHLIAWFAWGLQYDRPQIEWSLVWYVLNDPSWFILRIVTNQKKLYSKNLPQIIVGDAYRVWSSKGSFLYKNPLFLMVVLFPLILLVFGIYKMIVKQEYRLLLTSLPFFLTASFFFTLFFTLNRYFLVFLPIFLIIMIYWLQEIRTTPSSTWLSRWEKLTQVSLSVLLLAIYSLWLYSYYNTYKVHDDRFEVKKLAWEWVQENYINQKIISECMILSHSERWKECTTEKQTELRVMERFPVVTYYSGTQQRWLTPYTSSLKDVAEYASYNDIDILVVDTLDFKTYRPALSRLLDETKSHDWLELLQVVEKNNEKVILYRFKK